MAQAVRRAKSSRTQKHRTQRMPMQSSYDNSYCAIYPAMLGLLARGDAVSDIAAYRKTDPVFVAAVASGDMRIRDLEALDMSQHPPLPCARSSDVSDALELVDAACRALDADDRDEAAHYLAELRGVLDAYQSYWKL